VVIDIKWRDNVAVVHWQDDENRFNLTVSHHVGPEPALRFGAALTRSADG